MRNYTDSSHFIGYATAEQKSSGFADQFYVAGS